MILKRTVIVIFFNIFLFGTELKLPIKVREKGDIIFYDKEEVDLTENLFYNGNEKMAEEIAKSIREYLTR